MGVANEASARHVVEIGKARDDRFAERERERESAVAAFGK